MLVATFKSIGANFRMISSNSALRVRNVWDSASRRDKTSRNSRFWRKTSRVDSSRSRIDCNSSSVTGLVLADERLFLGGASVARLSFHIDCLHIAVKVASPAAHSSLGPG